MAKRVPGMFLIAAGCVILAAALGYGALRAFGSGTGAGRFIGTALTLAAFLTFLVGIACVVLGFGVDFR